MKEATRTGPTTARRTPTRGGFIAAFSTVAFLALWEDSATRFSAIKLLVSSPYQVLRYFVANASELFLDARVTFLESMCGLVLGGCIAAIAMTLATRRPFLVPWITAVGQTTQALPLVCLAPFFIMAFGFGVGSKIAMTALVSFLPLLIGLAGAYQSLPQDWNDYIAFRGVGPMRRLWFVIFRYRLPSLIEAAKVAASLSVIGALVAEFNGANLGLGRNLFIAAKRLEAELMISSLLLAVSLSLTYNWALSLADRLASKWYPD